MVVPLAIAINSEDKYLGPEIMAILSEKDPSLAGLEPILKTGETRMSSEWGRWQRSD